MEKTVILYYIQSSNMINRTQLNEIIDKSRQVWNGGQNSQFTSIVILREYHFIVGAEPSSLFDFSSIVADYISDWPVTAAQAGAAGPFDDVCLFKVGISNIQAHAGSAKPIRTRAQDFPAVAMGVQFSYCLFLFILNWEGAQAWAAERNPGHTDDFVVQLNLMPKGGIAGQAEAIVDIGVLEKMTKTVGGLVSLKAQAVGGTLAFGKVEFQFDLSEFLLGNKSSTAISGKSIGFSKHILQFKNYNLPQLIRNINEDVEVGFQIYFHQIRSKTIFTLICFRRLLKQKQETTVLEFFFLEKSHLQLFCVVSDRSFSQ